MAPPVGGYIAWYDASQITGLADGHAVTTWPDASGNGNDLDTSTGSPTFYNTTSAKLINGAPTVFFNGDGWLAMSHYLVIPQPYTIFAIAAASALPPGTGGSSGAATIYSAVSDFPVLFIRSVSPYWNMYPLAATHPAADTAPHVTTAMWRAATSFLRVDGAQVATGDTTGLDSTTNFVVGDINASAPISPWKGPIAEIIIYNSALSAGDIAAVEGYLAGRYGVTIAGVTAGLPLGPLTLTASGSASGTGATITGSATLNIGPLTVTVHSNLETRTSTAVVALGPLAIVTVTGRLGPGAHPVPGWRGRWRLTLHTRAFAPATLASTMIAELADARGRRLDQTWNTPATLTFTLDGRAQPAALVSELQQDVVAWRWDDQTGLEQPVFRGPICQSEDQVTADAHAVTYTCHDYAALLTRRLLTQTYTVTGRDQDLIVADLLARAVTVTTSSGTSLAPASWLPLSLYTADGTGRLRGLSGQLRDRTYYGSQNVATAVDDLAKVAAGFDYDVRPSAVDTTDSLRVFYPAQGVTRTDGIALQYGSTVASLTRSVNSADYANYIRTLGNNQSANPIPQFYGENWVASAQSLTPTPVGLWMLGDDAADVTVTSTLAEKGAGALNLNALLVPSYTLVMAPDAYVWGSPNMGDTVPLIVRSGRLNVNAAVRVLGISYDIGDDGQEDVTLTVSRPATELYKLFAQADRDSKALTRR